jgi:hypothetical protein
MFLNTKEDFKKYVIVSNEFSFTNITTIKPDALAEYFTPILGTDLIAEIETFESETDGTIKKTAFYKLENALAKYILFNYLVSGQLTIEDGSITRIENDNSKTAFKNQILDSRNQLEETALMILEELIDLMELNSVIFSNLATAPFKIESDNLLIKSAKEFNSIERLYRANTTFYSLITSQKTCIDLFLNSRYDQTLIDEIIENDSLSTEKAKFREYLQKALANFTIANAMEKNIVKFSKDGIVQIQQDKDTSSKIESKAESNAISTAIKKYRDDGHRYINLSDYYKNNNLIAFGMTEEDTPFEKTKPWM